MGTTADKTEVRVIGLSDAWLIRLRTIAFAFCAAMFLGSLLLWVLDVELPSALLLVLIVPFFVIFAVSVFQVLAYGVPSRFSPMNYSWRTYGEYVKSTPGDRLAGMAAIWFGAWLYSVLSMSRLPDESCSESACADQIDAASLRSMLAGIAMLTFAAAIHYDIARYWKARSGTGSGTSRPPKDLWSPHSP